MTLVRARITSNSRGGGVYATNGARLDTSTVSDITAARDGGGLYALGPVSIAHSTIARNVANRSGGSIWMPQPDVDALIVSNTTISRPDLRSANAGETGGLSGAPLAPLARQRLRDFRTATGGTIPLISAGGIDSADEAYARIRAGASLVQLYSALVYRGPSLAQRITHGLAKALERDGFANVAAAVGVDG